MLFRSETTEEGTSQDTERNWLSKGHSLPRHSRGRDNLGHRKEVTELGALTNWRQQREGQVRTQKGADRVRGTHFLETAEGGTSQDTKKTD